MNKLTKLIKDQPSSLKILEAVIAATITLGLTLAFVVMISTISKMGMIDLSLCFTNSCISYYIKETDQAFAIAKATFDLGVAIATIGGIFVALFSYFNTAANSALTNHIEHLKAFREYLEAEIKKRERLTLSRIDTLYLYNIIFQHSRSGRTTVSDEYSNFITKLNDIIQESNKKCQQGSLEGFRYKDHQRKVKEHLVTAGISVEYAPRNDYFEMEGQLFSLLHRLSQSFCTPGEIPSIVERQYN